MPNRRSPEEIKRSFAMAKKMAQRAKKKEDEVSVKYAKNALLVLAIIQALIAAYYVSNFPWMILEITIELGIAGIFLGLFFYAKKDPVAAITVALIVYGGIILLLAVIDPSTIFGAIILKGIIIAILVTGLNAAKKLPKPKSELSEDLLDNDLEF
ncbi:MAG: hypothetical protein GQ574_18115 [Crocinitomix sp.]|nr:hypothetical protein [Crocinitomix sp.]